MAYVFNDQEKAEIEAARLKSSPGDRPEAVNAGGNWVQFYTAPPTFCKNTSLLEIWTKKIKPNLRRVNASIAIKNIAICRSNDCLGGRFGIKPPCAKRNTAKPRTRRTRTGAEAYPVVPARHATR